MTTQDDHPNNWIQVPYDHVYFGWPVYTQNPLVGDHSELPVYAHLPTKNDHLAGNALVWTLRKYTRAGNYLE